MKILTKNEIEQALSIPEVIQVIEEGFALYSRSEAIIPPIAALHFDSPKGDCHIKYGYLKNGKYYVVKIASGFPDNVQKGLPTGNGLMLLFDKETGALLATILDEGYLTDLRTAAAGCIAAKYLASEKVTCIGIIGTGAQSYYQLKLLSFATKCRNVLVWGRNKQKALAFKNITNLQGWHIETADTIDQLANACNLIITTTSSTEPILFARHIKPGTHITAVGADDIGKQELDCQIFKMADRVVVDSRSQCLHFGDTSFALTSGAMQEMDLIELGEIISGTRAGRTSDSQITVADLTGIAIQDLQIAKLLYELL